MNSGRAALVENARAAIRRGSRGFALASRLCDRTTRERVWLLYAWCRKCDDLMDAQDHGGAPGRRDRPAVRLAAIRALTARALSGEFCAEPAFDGFGVVARECGIGHGLAEAVLDGFALDAADWRPRSGDDLMRYCWHAAGAVGVMMALVMCVSPDDRETLDRACDLGLSLQLGNIARDIGEDDAAGRCYLPGEWLEEAGIPREGLMRPLYRPALAGVAVRLVEISRQHEMSARTGLRGLAFRDRWAVLAAANIYRANARALVRAGEHAWDRRVAVGRWRRGRAVLRAFGAALLPRRRAFDGPLWTRDDLIALAANHGSIAQKNPESVG